MTEQKNGPDTGFYERFYRKWWFALLLNLAVMAVLLLVCRPKFETNDDMGIAFFINRARPIQDTYLLFENRILGIVMAKLYSITNMLPWYGLLQIAGLLTGFTAMTYVFLNHFEGWSGLLLSGGLLSLFAYEGYILMQSLKKSLTKIAVYFLFVLILVTCLGTLMFMVESSVPNTQFTDLATSVYWAIVTMTTVGYGDITPVTPIGRLLSAFVMLLGYTIIAVPTGIVTATIIDETQKKPNDGRCPRCGSNVRVKDRYCSHCGEKL